MLPWMTLTPAGTLPPAPARTLSLARTLPPTRTLSPSEDATPGEDPALLVRTLPPSLVRMLPPARMAHRCLHSRQAQGPQRSPCEVGGGRPLPVSPGLAVLLWCQDLWPR